jgi:hypothetical protein
MIEARTPRAFSRCQFFFRRHIGAGPGLPRESPTRGVDFATHFEGISSIEPGVYTLSADSAETGSANVLQASWVRVTRKADGTFDEGTWVDLNYPGTTRSLMSSNSVHGHAVVGVVIGADPFACQALVGRDA